jgi:hypothetical protein
MEKIEILDKYVNSEGTVYYDNLSDGLINNSEELLNKILSIAKVHTRTLKHLGHQIFIYRDYHFLRKHIIKIIDANNDITPEDVMKMFAGCINNRVITFNTETKLKSSEYNHNKENDKYLFGFELFKFSKKFNPGINDYQIFDLIKEDYQQDYFTYCFGSKIPFEAYIEMFFAHPDFNWEKMIVKKDIIVLMVKEIHFEKIENCEEYLDNLLNSLKLKYKIKC